MMIGNFARSAKRYLKNLVPSFFNSKYDKKYKKYINQKYGNGEIPSDFFSILRSRRLGSLKPIIRVHFKNGRSKILDPKDYGKKNIEIRSDNSERRELVLKRKKQIKKNNEKLFINHKKAIKKLIINYAKDLYIGDERLRVEKYLLDFAFPKLEKFVKDPKVILDCRLSLLESVYARKSIKSPVHTFNESITPYNSNYVLAC